MRRIFPGSRRCWMISVLYIIVMVWSSCESQVFRSGRPGPADRGGGPDTGGRGVTGVEYPAPRRRVRPVHHGGLYPLRQHGRAAPRGPERGVRPAHRETRRHGADQRPRGRPGRQRCRLSGRGTGRPRDVPGDVHRTPARRRRLRRRDLPPPGHRGQPVRRGWPVRSRGLLARDDVGGRVLDHAPRYGDARPHRASPGAADPVPALRHDLPPGRGLRRRPRRRPPFDRQRSRAVTGPRAVMARDGEPRRPVRGQSGRRPRCPPP